MPRTAEHDEFRVDVRRRDGVIAVRLEGELDLHAEPMLRAALDDAGIGRGSVVELHLGGLRFIDSTGLRYLVLCASRVKQVVIIDPTPHVEKVLEVGGLGDVFDVRRRAVAGPPFRAQRQQLDGTVVLHLIGDLDVSTLPRAHAAFDDAGIGPEVTVELHLDQLDHIDSSGLAAFVEIRRRAGAVVLVNPSPRVDRALRVSGLEAAFAIRRDAPLRASRPTEPAGPDSLLVGGV